MAAEIEEEAWEKLEARYRGAEGHGAGGDGAGFCGPQDMEAADESRRKYFDRMGLFDDAAESGRNELDEYKKEVEKFKNWRDHLKGGASDEDKSFLNILGLTGAKDEWVQKRVREAHYSVHDGDVDLVDMLWGSFDVLSYWAARKDKWLTLYKLAMSTLSAPASESFSERGFSWGSHQMSALRTLLGDDVIRALLVMKVRSNPNTGVFADIEEVLGPAGCSEGG